MPGRDPIGSSSGDHLTSHGKELVGDERVSRSAAVLTTILRGVRDPVIVIFLLAGIFDVLSGDPIVHGTVLFAVALALAWDAVRRRRAERAARGGIISGSGEQGHREGPNVPRAETAPSVGTGTDLRLSPIVGIGGLLYVVIVGGFARYSWPATIAVVVPGAAAVATAWRGPSHGLPEPEKVDPVGAIAWGAVFVVLAVWELAAFLLQPSLTTESAAHPTLSVLMDPVLASHTGRTIVLSMWLAFGWFLLQR